MPTHKAEGSKSYVTVNDAIEESGVSERTLRRWIADGKVHTVRDRTGHLRIDYDDVQAHARLRSDSPLRFQVHQLLARIEQLEQEVARLSQQIEEVRDAVLVRPDRPGGKAAREGRQAQSTGMVDYTGPTPPPGRLLERARHHL